MLIRAFGADSAEVAGIQGSRCMFIQPALIRHIMHRPSHNLEILDVVGVIGDIEAHLRDGSAQMYCPGQRTCGGNRYGLYLRMVAVGMCTVNIMAAHEQHVQGNIGIDVTLGVEHG